MQVPRQGPNHRNVPLAPLEFPDGKGGSFAGEWERFEGRAVGEHQTDMYWNIYGCHSGGSHSKFSFTKPPPPPAIPFPYIPI